MALHLQFQFALGVIRAGSIWVLLKLVATACAESAITSIADPVSEPCSSVAIGTSVGTVLQMKELAVSAVLASAHRVSAQVHTGANLKLVNLYS